jgi:hypothetical protein
MRIWQAAAVFAAGMAVMGCEPASITEARDQLRGGPARRVELAVPVARDTFAVQDVLTDLSGVQTTTLPSGVLGVPIAEDSVTFSTGGLIGGTVTAILDPAVLTFGVDATQELPTGALDLQGFEDAIRDGTIHTAPVTVAIVNTADAPVTLTGFTIGLVRIDPATGNPARDPGTGELVYETDGSVPIVAPLAAPGDTAVAVGRQTTTTVDLAAAPLVDRLADLLIDQVRTTIAIAGTLSIGDGTLGTVTGADEVLIRVAPVVGFDLTLPAGGVSFDSSLVENGLDLSADVAAELVAFLDSAAFDLAVTNATPFGVEATMAFVPSAVTGDVFQLPGRVEVAPLTVGAPSVAGDGTVVAPATADVAVALAGSDLGPFLGTEFTAGIRLRLLPPTGGRGALRATDWLAVRAGVRIVYRTGGAP